MKFISKQLKNCMVLLCIINTVFRIIDARENNGPDAKVDIASTSNETEELAISRFQRDAERNESQDVAESTTGTSETKPDQPSWNYLNTSAVDSNKTSSNPDVSPEVPDVKADSHKLRRVVCSYRNRSEPTRNLAPFAIKDINPHYCTHLFYEGLNISQINKFRHPKWPNILLHSRISGELFDEPLASLPEYAILGDLKLANPKLEIFLTVGETEADSFEDVLEDPDLLNSFLRATATVLSLFDFDGVNIQWLYPQSPELLTRLLAAIRSGFDEAGKEGFREDLKLGVTLSGSTLAIRERYNIRAISDRVDQMTFLAFNLNNKRGETELISHLFNDTVSCEPVDHFQRQGETTPSTTPTLVDSIVRPIVYNDRNNKRSISSQDVGFKSERESEGKGEHMDHLHTDDLKNELDFAELKEEEGEEETPSDYDSVGSIEDILDTAVKHGADRTKINIAVSLGSRAFSLFNLDDIKIGAQAKAIPTSLGNYPFHQTCRLPEQSIHQASKSDKSPYWTHGSIWMSFENEESLSQKIEYLREHYIGGIFLDSQAEDDFTGQFCANGTAFPMSKLAYEAANVEAKAYDDSFDFDASGYCSGCSSSFSCAVKLVLGTFALSLTQLQVC